MRSAGEDKLAQNTPGNLASFRFTYVSIGNGAYAPHKMSFNNLDASSSDVKIDNPPTTNAILVTFGSVGVWATVGMDIVFFFQYYTRTYICSSGWPGGSEGVWGGMVGLLRINSKTLGKHASPAKPVFFEKVKIHKSSGWGIEMKKQLLI